MNRLRNFFIFIFASTAVNLFGMEIRNYQPNFGVCNSTGSNTTLFAVRRYTEGRNEFLLTVDPSTLRVSIAKTSRVHFSKSSLSEIRRKYGNTNYVKALVDAEKTAGRLQNAGITHFPHLKNGAILTADLCPSILPMDRILFTSVINEFTKTGRPVPVALSVTGLWMEKHADDIKWLAMLEQKHLLSITWINHSYYHKRSEKLPLNKNFLLREGTKIDVEVLNTEKKMLELGLEPSVFFRFPGLVSDPDLFLKITGYGLIPVGSDAWLAKNQWPRDGNIILVHANGREPAGISRFIKLLQSKRKNISNKSWLLHGLRESTTL